MPVDLERRLRALEDGTELVVNALSITPIDDTRSALTLDAGLTAIELAAAVRPVSLHLFGGVYPLTRVVSGARAEFTGPVYQAEGASYYSLITVGPDSAAVEAIPVGGGYAVPAGGIPAVDLAQAVQTSLSRADAALPGNLGAAYAGNFLIVGQNGAVTTVALPVWEGGDY